MPTLIKGRRIASEWPSLPEDRILRLEPHHDPAEHASRLASVARVEVKFPKFGDGRGYSVARLLRERYGYRGELRAVGEVSRDHLYFLEQCGFDAFELRDGDDPREALAWFEVFTAAYQGTARQPAPLFRRRVAQAG